MGAGTLRPVVTRRTQVARLNAERLEANAIEAAEQCGAVWTPEVLPLEPLDRALSAWPAGRPLIFCDEAAPAAGPLDALAEAKAGDGAGLLIGPEGGFDEAERAAILRVPRVLRLSLGPRVLRADTAAVAALALVQATHRRLARPRQRRSDLTASRQPPFCRHDVGSSPRPSTGSDSECGSGSNGRRHGQFRCSRLS